MAFISIENVGETYNETELDSTVRVLTDISVEIQEGEFIALMGSSGSGKSTLQLSGGEQGRLAIARALVNQPPLLLADEPTGTLDSKTGSEIMEVFIELKCQGQTIFMVTHNQDNADLADRVLQIRDGSLVGCCSSPPNRTNSAPAGCKLQSEVELGGIHQQDAQRVGSGDYVVNAG